MLAGLPMSPEVEPLRCEIAGHPSFFPGGHSYQGPAFPVAPIMFVGHNFDTVRNFELSKLHGYENPATLHFDRDTPLTRRMCDPPDVGRSSLDHAQN